MHSNLHPHVTLTRGCACMFVIVQDLWFSGSVEELVKLRMKGLICRLLDDFWKCWD